MAKFLLMLGFILLTLTCERACAVSETGSSMWQSAHLAVTSLGDDAHSYLVSVFGKQAVDTLQNIKEKFQTAAHALNAVTTFITELLSAVVTAKLQILFIVGSMVFVAKWTLLLVLGYWLLSRTCWLIRAVIKVALLPLKCFSAFGKAFTKIKSVKKQIKEIKWTKKQK